MSRRLALPILLALPVSGLAGQERATLSQRSVVIYNVAGNITLRRGSTFSVSATPQGPDGSQLRFISDTEGSRGRFRVVYPDVQRIASPDGHTNTTSQIDLRADGTFGGDHDDWRRGRGDRVTVGGSRGFRGWADLQVTVPEGQTLVVHLVAGRFNAEGVNGDITVDTWGADAEATNIAGDWLFDTGSGTASVRGMRGTLKFDTGSGDASVTDMTGDVLDLDTGSGSVEVTNITVDRFNFDTGSGDVRATRMTARRGLVDTGSGRLDLAYAAGPIDDLSIDTGSGRVSLTLPPNPDVRMVIESGSAEALINRDGGVMERRDGDATVIRFGEGRGRIRIDTGSGGITIR